LLTEKIYFANLNNRLQTYEQFFSFFLRPISTERVLDEESEQIIL